MTVKLAINQMFKIAGLEVRYEDVIEREDEWYTEYTMTLEQREQWKQWFIDNSKHPKKMAERQFEMFDLTWGLKQAE